MAPFFTIVIATYNHAHLLPACIQSILDQTFTDWEAIVVNNHSTDNTIGVVESYHDNRIRIVPVHNDGILAKSRNVGIKEAKGKWICMLDSDDVWYPRKLELVYNAISEHPEYDVIAHNLMMKNMKNGALVPMGGSPLKGNIYRELLIHRNLFGQTSLCYKAAFLSSKNLLFDESRDVVTVEDLDFSMRLANEGAIFYRVMEYLGEWRLYGTNLSSSPIHVQNFYKLIHRHVYEIQKFDDNKDMLWRRVHAGALIKDANIYAHQKIIGKASFLYLKAFLESPVQVYTYMKDRILLSVRRIKFK